MNGLDRYLSDPKGDKAGEQLVTYWANQRKNEEKKHRKWRKEQAKNAVDVYWNEEKKNHYPVMHTVIEIKHSALYSEQPDPVVKRRFPDAPTWDKDLATFTERAIAYAKDTNPLEETMHRVVDDWLRCGLGQWRLRYHAKLEDVPNPEKLALGTQIEAAVIGMQNLEAPVLIDPQELEVMQLQFREMPDTIEEKVSEKIWWELVPWDRFSWQPCNSWEDCDWFGYDEYLTKAEIKDAYGKDPADGGGSAPDSWIRSKKTDDGYKVTEYFHRPSGKVYVIGEGFEEPLEVRDDTMGLRNMFPSPYPLMANPRSETLCPKPDYDFYKPIAERMNRTYGRIARLTEQMKDAGFYDGSLQELKALQNPTDGQFVAVNNMIQKLEGRTLEGTAVWHKPIENKAKVIAALKGELQDDETRVFRLTGVTDIVQGMSVDTEETYGATRIKSNWAEIRLTKQFDSLKAFLVRSYEMMAEVMLEQYSFDRLLQITGMEVDEQAMQVLKDDEGRCYAVDIEHELSISRDQQRDAQARGAALDRVISISQAALQLIPQGVWTPDFAQQAIQFAIGDFPEARSLSESVEQLPTNAQAMAQMQQQLQQVIGEAQQMQAQLEQSLQATQAELAKYSEGELAKDVADAEKKAAEAEKTRAETEQVMIETAQAAAPVVPPDALLDERLAIGQPPQLL